jgi:thiosulfate dehydrogenase
MSDHRDRVTRRSVDWSHDVGSNGMPLANGSRATSSIFRSLAGALVLIAAGCVFQDVRQGSEVQRPGSTSAADALFAPPSPETIPAGASGEQIRMGYEVIVRTQEYAKQYVGNALNCGNCHLDGGLNPNAASFVGLSATYPEHQSRAGRTVSLADRINECFERSLNGKALPQDSSKLQAVVSYIDWLSRDIPPGSRVAWRGVPPMSSNRVPDPVQGKAVYAKRCSFCHGTEGQGTVAAPAVWGPQSYTIAADMARISVAASFIKANMPRSWGWSLSDDEALDVAAYVNGQPRPDFSGKARDWANGGKPVDVPY